ncbi:MAG: response regulator [Proteobacteria bacterium]|nr:response regulator [Pseudomonadota bacterium]
MPKPFRLLMIDDNENDAEMATRALRDYTIPCELVYAREGASALERLNTPGEPVPSLILLDLSMPKMDGLEFLEQVKANPRLRPIPVVMFTSSESPAQIRQCYARYASCYIVKPFDGKEFTKVLRDLVNFWTHFAILPEVA